MCQEKKQEETADPLVKWSQSIQGRSSPAEGESSRMEPLERQSFSEAASSVLLQGQRNSPDNTFPPSPLLSTHRPKEIN